MKFFVFVLLAVLVLVPVVDRHVQRKAIRDKAALSAIYNRLIPLDAEDLAEGGLLEAVREHVAEFHAYLPDLKPFEEIFGPDQASYTVRFEGREYVIYDEKTPEGASWHRAAWAFFDIINRQLEEIGSAYTFYAISGGNDLSGVFLNQFEYDFLMKKSKENDRPYKPELDRP